MSVSFYEGRGFPSGLKNIDMGHYAGRRSLGDAGWDAVASVFNAPVNLFKGIFVDKPAAEQAAQVAIAQAQGLAAVQIQGQQELLAEERQKTFRTALLVGAGVLGLLAIGIILKRPRKVAVAGYRKSRRSHSRRSRR